MIKDAVHFQNGCKLIDLVTGGSKGVYGYPSGRIVNICGDKSSGKAQPLYSKILTPDGWKTMGEIKVGDKVIGLKGKPVDVIGVFPQGKRPIYEFEFQDHTTVRSADSHLWRVQSPNQYHDKTQFGKGKGISIITTQEIVDNWEHIKSTPAQQIYIPKHSPVEFEEKNLPIDPWLLGILIAEGSLHKNSVSFTNSEQDVIDKATEIVSKLDNHQLVTRPDKDSKGITCDIISKNRTRTGISIAIENLKLNVLSVEKFIPNIYLYSSIEQRKALLQGLFDGDGYTSKGGIFEYGTSSKKLAEDISELVRSLGGMAICGKPKTPFYLKNGKRVYCNENYRINIYMEDCSWVTSSEKHKKAVAKADSLKKCYWKWEHAKIIKDVRYIGEEECQCIYLADPDHCYITDGNTVTHNTALVNEVIAWSYWNYKDKFKWMYADCERGYSFDTEPVYGFQIHTDESDTPTTVEEAFYFIDKFAKSLKKDEFGIYVLDSLDALTSDEQDSRAEERIKAIENDKEMKGTYGMGKAKYLSQEFFPQLCKTLEDKNILLIIISQIRDNTDMFSFEKYSRSGGKALDFYCHMVIWLATAKKITVEKGEQKAVTGGTNKLKVTKGKVPRPYRECFYTYYFSFGIDNIATGVDYLFDLRTKSGDISAPAAKACEWEKDENKKSMAPADIKEWLTNLKRYDDYRATLKSGERFSMETALAFISSDSELKEKFDNEFAKVMDRDTLIKYIEGNDLEEELNRRVEEKWEAFESTLVLDRKPKYGKFYSQQPRSTDEDVII